MNEKAFLDTIAFSEIGPALLAISDNGYNVLVGSTPTHPLLFDSYATHPRIHNAKLNSDAAGRYQLMGRYYAPYAQQLGLTDFGPAAQDAIALQQVKECRALDDIQKGDLYTAVFKCRRIWASFPAAGYGQHENSFDSLQLAFTNAGGTLA